MKQAAAREAPLAWRRPEIFSIRHMNGGPLRRRSYIERHFEMDECWWPGYNPASSPLRLPATAPSQRPQEPKTDAHVGVVDGDGARRTLSRLGRLLGAAS